MCQIQKALKQAFKKESNLIFQLHTAKELGMTLAQLQREMTYEELELWSLYFDFVNTQNQEAMNKASRRR